MKRSTSQKGLTGESERKTKPNPKGNSVEYYGIFVARSNGNEKYTRRKHQIHINPSSNKQSAPPSRLSPWKN